MTLNVPTFPSFYVDDIPTSIGPRWRKWLSSLKKFNVGNEFNGCTTEANTTSSPNNDATT